MYKFVQNVRGRGYSLYNSWRGWGVGCVFLGGWGLFTSEFVGGGGSIVPLGHRSTGLCIHTTLGGNFHLNWFYHLGGGGQESKQHTGTHIFFFFFFFLSSFIYPGYIHD